MSSVNDAGEIQIVQPCHSAPQKAQSVGRGGHLFLFFLALVLPGSAGSLPA